MIALAWMGAVVFLGVAGIVLFPGVVLDPWFRRMLRPKARTPRALPDAMARRAEDVTITATRGPIKAWLVWPPDSGDREGGERPTAQAADSALARPIDRATGIAVFIHGWSSDGGRMAPLAKSVVDAGVACLLVDLPGHGRTGRTEFYNAKLMVDDLGAVRDWIGGREDLAGLKSAILGYSFGGVGAIVAAVRDPRWAALVVMAAPVGPMQAIEFYLEGRGFAARWIRGPLRKTAARVTGVDPDTYAGTYNLPSLRVPALFVHGCLDEVVPCQHATWLHASAPSGLAELVLVEGAGHDGLLMNGEAGRHVASFLGRVLAGAPVVSPEERG